MRAIGYRSRLAELQLRRKALGYTTQDVADALGCSLMGVNYAERGKRPNGSVVRQLAELLIRLENEQDRQS